MLSRSARLCRFYIEEQKRHIAVLVVIGIEQRELLCSIRIGIGIVGIDDNLLRSLVKRRYVFIEEQLPYAIEGLAADVVLQTGHRGL